jgi:methylmalonyl-CoA/ethylmalonyl-CoA epimerase
MTPTHIAQVAIIVRDVERAKTFYRDRMGLKWLFDAPPGLSFFQCGEVRLMLTPPEGLDAAGFSIVYYNVADIEAAHRELVEAGVPFESDPHFIATVGNNDLWLAICRDPDGNIVGLMSERPSVQA